MHRWTIILPRPSVDYSYTLYTAWTLVLPWIIMMDSVANSESLSLSPVSWIVNNAVIYMGTYTCISSIKWDNNYSEYTSLRIKSNYSAHELLQDWRWGYQKLDDYVLRSRIYMYLVSIGNLENGQINFFFMFTIRKLMNNCEYAWMIFIM